MNRFETVGDVRQGSADNHTSSRNPGRALHLCLDLNRLDPAVLARGLRWGCCYVIGHGWESST
jgi:hypothetical protein